MIVAGGLVSIITFFLICLSAQGQDKFQGLEQGHAYRGCSGDPACKNCRNRELGNHCMSWVIRSGISSLVLGGPKFARETTLNFKYLWAQKHVLAWVSEKSVDLFQNEPAILNRPNLDLVSWGSPKSSVTCAQFISSVSSRKCWLSRGTVGTWLDSTSYVLEISFSDKAG